MTVMTITSIVFSQDKQVGSEFVVVKKKKESTVHVKEDIGYALEISLRQIGKNITQSVIVQNQIFNKIKDLLGACEKNNDSKSTFDASTAQLKIYRNQLESFYHKLEQQQVELESFLSCFK